MVNIAINILVQLILAYIKYRFPAQGVVQAVEEVEGAAADAFRRKTTRPLRDLMDRLRSQRGS